MLEKKKVLESALNSAQSYTKLFSGLHFFYCRSKVQKRISSKIQKKDGN